MKIIKTVNLTNFYLMIETMAELSRAGHSIEDIFSLSYSIFKLDCLKEGLNLLNDGESIEAVMKKVVPIPLFIEFFNFYIQTNSFSDSLMKSLKICKNKEDLQRKIIKSLAYPFFLTLGLLLFSFVAIFYLQPQFNQFFQSFNMQISPLEYSLRMILFSLPIILFVIIVLSLIIVFNFYKDISHQNYAKLDKWLNYFVFRQIIQKYYSIKFCLYYKEFVLLRYDISTIFSLLSTKLKDRNLMMVVYELKEKVLTGKDIVLIVDDFVYFEEYFKIVFKLSLSVQSPYLLLEQYYSSSLIMIETKIKRFIQILLPCIYSFISLYIIGIYAGMILPMMNMIDKI